MVSKTWVTLATCTLVACASGRSGSNLDPGRGSSAPEARRAAVARLTASRAFVELCQGPRSLPLEVAGSRHFVSVTLAGPRATETIRFHVDSGGNTAGLALRRSIAERLGFTSPESMPRTLRISGREIALPQGASWYLVDDLSAEGAKEAKQDYAARKDFDALGQLGAGFLSRFLVCIDPPAGRIAFVEPQSVDIDQIDTPFVPLALVPGGPGHALYPFVLAHLGEMPFGLLVDTGASGSMLEKAYLQELAKAEPTWPTAVGTAGDADMHAGVHPTPMIGVPRIRLTFPEALGPASGLRTIPSVDMGSGIFQAQPDGTFEEFWGNPWGAGAAAGALANDVLDRYRLLIDYRRGRLFLQPTGRKPDVSASMTRIGASIAFGDDGCPIIRQITSTNAPLVRNQLQLGDTLVEVDGRDTCKAWHHEVAALLAGQPGEQKHLVVRRDGKRLSLTLPVSDLLPLPSQAASSAVLPAASTN